MLTQNPHSDLVLPRPGTPLKYLAKTLAKALAGLLVGWVNALLLVACAVSSTQVCAWSKPGQVANNVISASAACASCHAERAAQWQDSHHALAMQEAGSSTLAADFATTVQHGSLTATFAHDAKAAWVTLQQGAAPASQHPVRYAFGIEPLQQYLTEAPGGRMQVLPWAWDTRAASQGGQRWFTLFEPEGRPPNDRLHWQQPLQNWNGMCADCHATNLQRNYDAQSNRFATDWQALNVGCLACHVKAEDESEIQVRANGGANARANAGAEDRGQDPSGFSPTRQGWQRAPGTPTARLSKTRDNSYMDGCAACHSLRTPLTNGFQAGQAYLDNFALSLLEPNLYHPDGQIKEEVYIWGSFLQSKMFAQGVTCNDCHNPHSLELRAEGDALCGQCHALPQFAQVQHHGHVQGRIGSQCVSCHMPTTTYMGVDARHDHKFVVPRPHLAAEFAVPNACADCHADQGPHWAAQALQKLHGEPQALTPSQHAVLTSQRFLPAGGVSPLSTRQLNAVLADSTLPQITQASVLARQARLLPAGQAPVPVATLARLTGAADKNALLGLAALEIAKTLPAKQRLRIAQASLAAPRRSLRVAAADALLGVALPAADQASFAAAFAELTVAQLQTAWRGEGRMNLALTQLRLGNLAAAEQQYQQALQLDPYFAPAYVNLADLYRQQQRTLEAAALYSSAITAVPKDAAVRYSYALHLVRVKQLQQALVQSKAAVDLAAGDVQMATLHVLVLDRLGRTREGLLWLQDSWASLLEVGAVRQLGLSLAGKIDDPLLYRWFRDVQKP